MDKNKIRAAKFFHLERKVATEIKSKLDVLEFIIFIFHRFWISKFERDQVMNHV